MRLNFKDRLLLGLCTVNAIEGEIEAWHKGAGQNQALHDYLGLTQSEYGAWLKTGLDTTLLMQIMPQRTVCDFRLYQVDTNIPDGQQLVFRPLPIFCGSCPPIHAEVYRQVYAGTVLCGKDWPNRKIAERLFYMFNMEQPNDFTARSLSTSDVVALHGKKGERFYFCDNFGFTRVTFDPKAAAPQEVTSHDQSE